MNRLEWLDTATGKIVFRPDREAVRKELEAHFEDLREARGLDEEAATAAMGDPSALAEELGRIHRPWPGYLWRVSRWLLLAALVACLALCGRKVLRNTVQTPLDRLPGWELYDYLTWKFETVIGAPEEYEMLPGGSVTAGGCTIRAESAVIRRTGDAARETPWWSLSLYFHINAGWRGEELCWGPDIISEIRDSAGNRYGVYGPSQYYYYGSSSALPFLGQKAALYLNDVPEDTAWVEIDIGHGELERTLHVDLTKEAGV